MEDRRILNSSQANKLTALMATAFEIQPRANFPPLSVTPARLLSEVKKCLLKKDISIRDVRLNGSAASYCICEDQDVYPQIRYNNIDLVIGVQIRDDRDFHIIKHTVMETLMGFLPQTTNLTPHLMEKVYVGKMILVSDEDNKWSLISLGNPECASGHSTTIELKFEERIKRKYEFSVDSFEILLDSYLDRVEASPYSESTSFGFFCAVSTYDNYDKALYYLNNRLIHTRNPEEIRGGGLLKYCNLLVKGFKPASLKAIHRLRPYMCSRFFIDFPTVDVQQAKICKYVESKFMDQGYHRGVLDALGLLNHLKYAIKYWARCLMKRDKHQTTKMICDIQSHLFPPTPPFSSPLLSVPAGYPQQQSCSHQTVGQYRTHCSGRYNSGSSAGAGAIAYRPINSPMAAYSNAFPSSAYSKSTSSHFPLSRGRC